MTAKPKRKPAEPIPEPPPVFAVPENPLSSDPERTAIRVEGITYLFPTRSRPCPSPEEPKPPVTSSSNTDAEPFSSLAPQLPAAKPADN